MDTKNLLSRTNDRIKLNKNVSKSTIKRCLLNLILAGTISLSTVGLTACDPNNPNNILNNNGNNGNTTVVTPGGDDSQESKYSKILQDVLNSSYYNSIVDAYRARRAESKFDTGNLESCIPYTFLASQGHDIQAIKNDELECESMGYILNGDTSTLYLTTRVETKASTPYYTCYILKYDLTEQEYDDLYMLHKNDYIQAGLFIQELDAQKTAKLESKTNITVSGYEAMVAVREKNDEELFDTLIKIDIVQIINDREIIANVRGSTGEKKMLHTDRKLRTLHYKFYRGASSSYNNNIFNVKRPIDCMLVNLEEYQTTYDTIMCFDSCNTYAPSSGLALTEDK